MISFSVLRNLLFLFFVTKMSVLDQFGNSKNIKECSEPNSLSESLSLNIGLAGP